ncbi:MAG TPA: hypothetical protein VGJ39_09260 [Vicinamibacterales bacterium]
MNVYGKDITVQGRLIRIATPELDSYEPLTDPEAMLVSLRKTGVRIDLFTFMQTASEPLPKYSYPMGWDNLAVLPVTTFDHWWNHQIRSYPRNRARQAAKHGVTVREVPFDDALVKGIWEVYNESPIRQGKRNVHFGKDIRTVRKEEATFLDRSIFIGAHLGDELIGFVKLVTDEGQTQANLMNVVAMIKHRDSAPTNALIAESVRVCAARGIRYLLYQNFTYGNKKPDSLTNFKEVNGFQRVEVPRYYVPLTLAGRAALRLGLHRGLVNHIPEPVLVTFRRIRSLWYNRRFQTATS